MCIFGVGGVREYFYGEVCEGLVVIFLGSVGLGKGIDCFLGL